MIYSSPLRRHGRRGTGHAVDRFHRSAGAEEVHVAVGIVQPRNAGPELLLLEPRERVCRRLPRVRSLPLADDQVFGAVWCHLEHIALSGLLAVFDFLNLGSD